jgi:hypothetical protein
VSPGRGIFRRIGCQRPAETRAVTGAYEESVSATLPRAARYAGSGLSNAKQGALRSASREGGRFARTGPCTEFVVYAASANAIAGSPSPAAGILGLDGRALDRPVRTKHAAITGQRPQQCVALFAFVEELARVRRHRLRLRVAAPRTGQHGFKQDRSHLSSHFGGLIGECGMALGVDSCLLCSTTKRRTRP